VDAPRARPRPDRRRGGALGCLLQLLALAAVAYVGYRLGTPHWERWRFENEMAAQAGTAAVNDDAEIRGNLLAVAEGMELPLAPGDLRIERQADTLRVSASWTREVVLPGFRKQLHFSPQVTSPIAQTPP
jgi:hypothetical protein